MVSLGSGCLFCCSIVVEISGPDPTLLGSVLSVAWLIIGGNDVMMVL